MPAWRKTVAASLVSALALLALVGSAPAEERSAFIEFSSADLAELDIWEDSSFGPAGEIFYNRVDGLLVYMGMQYRSESQLHPRFEATWGWPSARSASYYQLGVEQPVFDQDSFSFGVDLSKRSAWSLEDDEAVSDLGNNLNAFFARIDDRDYFVQDGVTVFAQHRVNDRLRLRGEYRSHQLESLRERESIWTVFQREDDWRENPALMRGVLKSAREFEGTLISTAWTVEYDSRDDEAMTGWWVRGVSEFGVNASGGDYDFRKHIVQAEKTFPISFTQTLDLSGTWGIGDGTTFPSHKLFHLGGRGNLRGYDHKEFAGKNMLFGRAEYNVRVNKSLTMVYFLESGQVGYTTSLPESDDSDGHKHDAGIGFRFGETDEGWIRLDVARAMEAERDIKVYLSIFSTH